MNALRQFITSTNSESIQINLPAEYRGQKLEIIILPMEEFDPKNELTLLMDKMSENAKKKGLSPEKLEKILND
jgi:hypothetical protein